MANGKGYPKKKQAGTTMKPSTMIPKAKPSTMKPSTMKPSTMGKKKKAK